MGATNRTQNYNLPQFVGNDKPTWLGDVNGAMNLIDAQMKANNDLANLAKTTADTAQTTATSAETIATSAQETAEGAETTSNTALSKALEVEGALSNLLQLVFPIGSTYVTQNSNDNPNSILGFGTWVRFNGKVALGVDENVTELNTIGATGGEVRHRLTIQEMPAHSHTVTQNSLGASNTTQVGSGSYASVGNPTGEISIGLTGGNDHHNNMQPYEVVGYMWKRTA